LKRLTLAALRTPKVLYTYPGFIAPRTYSISTTLPDEKFSVPFAINHRTECSRLDHRRMTGNDHQGIVGCAGRRLQRRDKQSPCYTRAAIQNETQTEHAMMIRMFRDTLFMGGKIPEKCFFHESKRCSSNTVSSQSGPGQNLRRTRPFLSSSHLQRER